MDSELSSFRSAFKELTCHGPFPWQERLYMCFIDGCIPDVADLPTGLGKTSVIAVWLLAYLAKPTGLPRRLVYVVNRRTVVDQTTAEVERLRENLPKLGNDKIATLAISTLRGQFADNHEWSADPSQPAVICGTVDMIGSRLLFEGYRIGFKSRPLHAGFLGQDALLVHDEAHLEPAFQRLIETIRDEQKRERKRNSELPWHGLRVMALSATARREDENRKSEDCQPFELTEEEKQPPDDLPSPPTEPIHHVWHRLKAKKSLRLHPIENEKQQLADKVAELALKHKSSNTAVLIFVRTVDDVNKVCDKLKDKKNGISDAQVQTLTGTMRGYERDELVRSNTVFARFLQPGDRPKDITATEGAVYLVCTSAGEVGVNLSADHMVCDLSTFDSMAQRLGRVNRFGDRNDTVVDVVHPTEFDDKKPNPQREATLALLKQLNGDASPKALGNLPAIERLAAFAPEPKYLAATDILFDAWAMTSIKGKMPGRPPVAPYLHGVAEWEPSRTSVAWREEVEVVTPGLLEQHRDDFPQELLADYPLKPHELLSDTTERVYKALEVMAKRLQDDYPIWIVDEHGEVEVTSIQETLKPEKKRVVERLVSATVLLPPSAGGLQNGLLVGNFELADDVADLWLDEDKQPRRGRIWDGATPPTGMALIRTIDTKPDADEIESDEDGNGSTARRFWHWFARPRDAEDATRASARPVAWQHHTDDVVKLATKIVDGLNLPEDLQQAVILAAKLHDLGKKRELWQRSIGNPNPTDWHAKPGKPTHGPRWRPRHLNDYRHEFGSLLDALDKSQEHRAELEQLSTEMLDVVLHLIAAHHGRARPHFSPTEIIDSEHSSALAESESVEVMRRYARLQRKYGRWGLAYLESLLRAADWEASANPSTLEDAT